MWHLRFDIFGLPDFPVKSKSPARKMDDLAVAPSFFLIDNHLWCKFNNELRAACHWCTHHHTTTPAEAAKQLERGEGWPRDWISRKVKNSTRQFGGLFICPALDCAGHSNSKGERRRRWFCRFCINRHLGVDLRSYFQLDEMQGKWIQVPNLVCWHCQARQGNADCVNCPQKHSKRAKRLREGMHLQHSGGIAVFNTPSSGVSGAAPALLRVVALDSNYEKGAEFSEGRLLHTLEDDGPFAATAAPEEPGISQGSLGAEVRFMRSLPQRSFFIEKGILCRNSQESVIPGLIDFVNNSCTTFHATAEAKKHLLNVGFQQLSECEEWALQPGGRYFFTHNMSSIFAFAVGCKYKPGCGFHIVAAHIDSPCPKLKPVSAVSKGGYLHVRVQTCGAGLWHTWFDRDLSIAGRVLLRRKGGELAHELVRVRRPILRIPTCPLHSDRSTLSGGMKVDIEAEMAPILAVQIEAELAASCESDASGRTDHDNSCVCGAGLSHHPLLLQSVDYTSWIEELVSLANHAARPKLVFGSWKELSYYSLPWKITSAFDLQLGSFLDVSNNTVPTQFRDTFRFERDSSNDFKLVLAEELKCEMDEIADFQLSVYDTQAGCVAGGRHEFVFAGRLDNLATAFCALWALVDTCAEPTSLEEESAIRMVALVDNGEIRTDSALGVGTQTMFRTMMRIARWLAHGCDREGIVERTICRSFIVVAADMAHAVHPSYVTDIGEESLNYPKVLEGLVIKHDASQNNAMDADTAFLFREVAKRNCIPTQNYSVMRYAGCCSTVSPILAAGYGIRIVDCGLPQLSMHSVREMCAVEDINAAFQHFKAFFHDFTFLDNQLS